MTDFESLGPYRIEAKLGQGGMGSVYRGVHVKTGQRVAVKVLARHMSDQRRFRERFAAEIETLKKLNHPNIVRLIGHGEEDGAVFYAMELVEGPSLLEHLRKVKRLDWDTTIGYAIEICSALKHAHDFGVIHRDLKPANLLLEPEGPIKLTDFGIAKLFGAAEHTAAGSVLGTADYMSPEQAVGGKITARSDLYALGSLMYACLVGRPPFGGRNLTQVVYGLKHEAPAPLDLVLPEVPEELAELIHELLEKDPQNRPPTALVVSKRLQAMRAGLRSRRDRTEMNFSSPTLPEVPESVVQPRVPVSTRHDRSPNVADLPTADDGGAGTPTGAAIAVGKTMASVDSEDYELADDRITSVPRTHFETVPAPEDRRARLERDTSQVESSTQWISVAGLIITLLVLTGVGFWFTRAPSAEDLLTQLQQAETIGDSRAADRAREEFLRLYPEDERADSVREVVVMDDVEGVARRLRTKANKLGGIVALPPAEQTWLEAMNLRSIDPREAAKSLKTWLAVYDHPQAFEAGPGSNTIRRYVDLARKEMERLDALAKTHTDPREEELREWITWGLTTLKGEDREQFLSSAKSLYGDKPWARTLLESYE